MRSGVARAQVYQASGHGLGAMLGERFAPGLVAGGSRVAGDEYVSIGVSLQYSAIRATLASSSGLQDGRVRLELNVLDADGDALVGRGDADVGHAGDRLFHLGLDAPRSISVDSTSLD